jgi:hypothetical protein
MKNSTTGRRAGEGDDVTTRTVKVWAAVSDRGTLRSLYSPGADRDAVDACLQRDERRVRATVTFPVPAKKARKKAVTR